MTSSPEGKEDSARLKRAAEALASTISEGLRVAVSPIPSPPRAFTSTQTFLNMVLKLYGNPASTCTQRVITVLEAKKVAYELPKLNEGFTWIKDPSYIENFQPFGQMPAIDDDGFILFQSRAIMAYIAAKYAGQGEDLLPAGDLKSQALHAQAVSIEAFDFDPSASGIAAEMVFKPMRGAGTNEAHLKQLVETLAAKLKAYDQILSKQKYLAGDKLTIADLSHLPYGKMALELGKADGLKTLPNVSRWWSEITAFPAWKVACEKADAAKAAMSKAK